MLEVLCHCGNTIETDFETEVDLSEGSEVFKNILNGSFMTFYCPKCENDIKTEVAVHLFDKKKGIDISFFPEVQRLNYLSGNISVQSERVVIGYQELHEKIVILGENLDDRIIEIIKFRLIESSDKKDISIYLNSLDGEELIFYIHGLKAEEVGISRISMDFYKRIETDLEKLLNKSEIKQLTEGPYVSVNSIYLEE